MKTLAVVTRGGNVESIHQGFICVVDSEGRVIYQKGDINTSIFDQLRNLFRSFLLSIPGELRKWVTV